MSDPPVRAPLTAILVASTAGVVTLLLTSSLFAAVGAAAVPLAVYYGWALWSRGRR